MTDGMAYCLALVTRGGATWGGTQAEALANLEAVVKLVVASLAEHGEPVADFDLTPCSHRTRLGSEAVPKFEIEPSPRPLTHPDRLPISAYLRTNPDLTA